MKTYVEYDVKVDGYESTIVKTKKERSYIKISVIADAINFLRKNTPWAESAGVNERVYTIYLDRSNNIIAFNLTSIGGITQAIVPTKLILFNAINLLAESVILVHNHPSGQLKASRGDRLMTDKLKEALKTIGSSLLDSIIIDEDFNYISIIEE